MLDNSRWQGAIIVLMPLILGTSLMMSSQAVAQSSRTSREVSFEDQFWKYLVGNNYKNWSPGPNKSAGFVRGKEPHGPYVKTYVNRTAAGSVDDMELGSVVIMENYREDQSLKTISVMYRTAGFNPSGNDWYWIEYEPDGSVVPSANEADRPRNRIRNVSLTTSSKHRMMGKSAQCIQCHQSAAGNDFVFSNDRFENALENVAQNEAAQESDKASTEEESDKVDFVADADTFFGSR